MNSEPREITAEEDDADEELTRLEWESSHRALSAEEQNRLSQLRADKTEVAQDVQDRVAPPDPGNPVVSGDDSP